LATDFRLWLRTHSKPIKQNRSSSLRGSFQTKGSKLGEEMSVLIPLGRILFAIFVVAKTPKQLYFQQKTATLKTALGAHAFLNEPHSCAIDLNQKAKPSAT